jgi:uncharacterized radical SAM superfamily Fe-S cluster-containing enzyme
MTEFRDYTYLGMTQSLCPTCLNVVPAKVIARGRRVYFRKSCPQHGLREDFVCSDVGWFDRTDYSLPGKVPLQFGAAADRGCPYDCGLCTEHEQHTCIGLLEITSGCNLTCPMCFAMSAPGQDHLSYEDCVAAIDRLVEIEGRPEILQLSGGEPTIHPDFHRIHEYACDQPIDIVMINTNGIRFARDDAFLERVAELNHRTEIYLQFDTFRDAGYETLRGESLLDTKLKAVERLATVGLNTILVCTVQPDVNEDEVGKLVRYAQQSPNITGVSFQPATYSGRHVQPTTLDRRITFPDIIQGIAKQTDGEWAETDFAPLPCAHPNAHTLAYAFRYQNRLLPLARFIDLENHLDLLSGRITFDRGRASALINEFLSRQACGQGGCEPSEASVSMQSGPKAVQTSAAQADLSPWQQEAAGEFFRRVLQQDIGGQDMFRITTTTFMDAYNFDVRQLMKSCVHFLLPSGHVVPFSAYNVLYREGHVPLPPLQVQPVTLS